MDTVASHSFSLWGQGWGRFLKLYAFSRSWKAWLGADKLSFAFHRVVLIAHIWVLSLNSAELGWLSTHAHLLCAKSNTHHSWGHAQEASHRLGMCVMRHTECWGCPKATQRDPHMRHSQWLMGWLSDIVHKVFGRIHVYLGCSKPWLMFSMSLCTPQLGSSPSALDEARKKYPLRQHPAKLGNPCTHLHVLTFCWGRNNRPKGSPLVLSCALEGGVMWVKWNSYFSPFNVFVLNFFIPLVCWNFFTWTPGLPQNYSDPLVFIKISVWGRKTSETPILPCCLCILGSTIFLITVTWQLIYMKYLINSF